MSIAQSAATKEEAGKDANLEGADVAAPSVGHWVGVLAQKSPRGWGCLRGLGMQHQAVPLKA